MNPLKERRTVTTAKTITTLFICGSLLVGFIGISLSLSQTASATTQGNPSDTRPTPQCEGDFDRGECEVRTVTCPSDFPIEVKDASGTIIRCDRVVTDPAGPQCSGANTEFRVIDGRGECFNTKSQTITGNPKCTGEGFSLNADRTKCQKTESTPPIITTKTIRPGQGPERLVD
jgi:hypothetical protein